MGSFLISFQEVPAESISSARCVYTQHMSRTRSLMSI